jgi:uncharacterized protein YcfJ
MKLGIFLAAVAAALAAQPAFADRRYSRAYYAPQPAYAVMRVADAGPPARGTRPGAVVQAPVIDVQPIVRHVTVSTPVRECWDETVYREPNRGTGAVVAGGIIGGTVGHQFGSGRGQDAMTLVGALVGSAVAHNVVQRNAQPAYAETVQRCETRTELREEERIEGYEVTYKYDGQKYRTRMREHPGSEIAVRVSVTPVGY